MKWFGIQQRGVCFVDEKVKFLECQCKDSSHLVVVRCDIFENEMPEIYIGYQLNHYLPWHKRVIHAIKYVIGITNKGSSWDTVILTDQGVQDLQTVIKEYNKNKKISERVTLKTKA